MTAEQYQAVLRDFNESEAKFSFLADAQAKAQLTERIYRALAMGRTLTYSQLVQGIVFSHPFDEPSEITEWDGFNRQVIGWTLADILLTEWPKAQCVITTAVVDKVEQQPSLTLFKWLGEYGVVGVNDEEREAWWVAELNKAFAAYQRRAAPRS